MTDYTPPPNPTGSTIGDPQPKRQPTPQEMQAEIHRQLVETELKIRQWLESDTGKQAVKAVKVAKVAVPAAGAAAMALWAGSSWLARRRDRRTLHREMAEMEPVTTEGRESLKFIRESLLGLAKPGVAKLLGPPAEKHEPTGRWSYPLRRGAEAASVEIRFNEADQVEDATFYAREDPLSASAARGR